VRHAHNLDLIMEKRVLESFAGRDAALSVAPAQPTEMRPDRWRKFVVIEGGKSVTRVGREARSVASARMKTNWRAQPRAKPQHWLWFGTALLAMAVIASIVILADL